MGGESGKRICYCWGFLEFFGCYGGDSEVGFILGVDVGFLGSMFWV